MCSLNHVNARRVMFNTHPNTVNVQRHRPNTIQYPPKHSPGTIYALIEVNRNKLHQQTLPDTRPLKSVGVPPTAKLWPDWSPQKRVNRDKLDQKALVPPNSFGPPPMGGVGVDFKDRAVMFVECLVFWLNNIRQVCSGIFQPPENIT